MTSFEKSENMESRDPGGSLPLTRVFEEKGNGLDAREGLRSGGWLALVRIGILS